MQKKRRENIPLHKKTAGNYLLAVGGPEKTCTKGISKSPHRYYAGVGLTYSLVQKARNFSGFPLPKDKATLFQLYCIYFFTLFCHRQIFINYYQQIQMILNEISKHFFKILFYKCRENAIIECPLFIIFFKNTFPQLRLFSLTHCWRGGWHRF